MPKFNEPVDYAFYSSKKKTDTPILLLEAKRLGSDLAHKNHVKQLHMINSRIRLALDSLLSTPFDTLMAAIRREFKEERCRAIVWRTRKSSRRTKSVGLPDGIKIRQTHIEAYLASISDEAGRIPVDLEAEAIHTDEAVEDSVLTSGTRSQGERVRPHGKRVSIGRSVDSRTRP